MQKRINTKIKSLPELWSTSVSVFVFYFVRGRTAEWLACARGRGFKSQRCQKWWNL